MGSTQGGDEAPRERLGTKIWYHK